VSEREAIAKLAALVARIADRCWEQLGTDESTDIKQLADGVFKAMIQKRPSRRRS
jgi:hypothetical protein